MQLDLLLSTAVVIRMQILRQKNAGFVKAQESKLVIAAKAVGRALTVKVIAQSAKVLQSKYARAVKELVSENNGT